MSLYTEIHKFFTNYFNNDPLIIDTFKNLSIDSFSNPLVNNNTLAFSFDYITQKLLNASNIHRGTDALYIKNEIFLIEFKRNIFGSSKKQKEKRVVVREKMSTGLHLIEKIVIPNACLSVDPDRIKINYILVVDSAVEPIAAVSAVVSNISGIRQQINNCEFVHYECKFINQKTSNRIFYDSVEVWNDINFDINLSLC